MFRKGFGLYGIGEGGGLIGGCRLLLGCVVDYFRGAKDLCIRLMLFSMLVELYHGALYLNDDGSGDYVPCIL